MAATPEVEMRFSAGGLCLLWGLRLLRRCGVHLDARRIGEAAADWIVYLRFHPGGKWRRLGSLKRRRA